jgi:hypothetical protein
MLNVEGPVTVYLNTHKAIRLLRLRLLCVVVPTNVIFFAMLSTSLGPLDDFNKVLRWCLLAEIPILYLLVSRMLTRQTKPIVSLSSSGITVDTPGSRVGFLRWEEIKDVYIYNFGYFFRGLGWRFVGITLNDAPAVCARIGLKRSWSLRLNGLVAPLYKPLRIRIAPVSIPQEYLLMSAEDLLAQIQAYRATYS